MDFLQKYCRIKYVPLAMADLTPGGLGAAGLVMDGP